MDMGDLTIDLFSLIDPIRLDQPGRSLPAHKWPEDWPEREVVELGSAQGLYGLSRLGLRERNSANLR
jgi:hypothetical protein